MANKARLDTPNGESVRALTACSKGHTFYCNNQGCSARMHLCKEGTNSPYFSSYNRTDHAFDFCLDSSLCFYPDKIAEECFNLDDSINRICHKADNDIHNRNGGTHNVNVGTGKKIGINTTKGMFAMCEYVGCGNTYNGIEIDSIFLCQENRAKYKLALAGFCLIEAKYRRKVTNCPIIEFSFSHSDTQKISIAAIFNTEKEAWNFYNSIKGRDDFKQFTYVIAGEWKIDASGTYDYTCHIEKQSQIFFIFK